MYKYAMQLLELEQRFESYCTINQEEIKQIKMALEQLREDILSFNHNYPVNHNQLLVADTFSDTSEKSGEKE